MVYANDEWVQVPVMQLYDTGLMQQAINNARYMYEKAEKRMDDFYEKYGEFMSPFQKDMDRYNQIVGNIKNVVDNLYATGEDPLRTASGRAKMAAAIRSVNPAEFAAMKSNAKMGYAYLDAAQKLRSQGKYSEAQELFDILQGNGKTMGEFATLDPLTGRFNSWDRTSPIEAVSLRDLTQDSYKGRTARILNENDFNDPRLAGYKYDPKYEWTGYLYSDLLKNAPGASLALAGDPRAAFFRDQARQMVIARGEKPTAAAVEKQFQKNIADANTWALIDPDRKADQFALDKFRTENDNWLDKQRQARQHYYHGLENQPKVEYNPNIFREAEALAPKYNPAHIMGYGSKAGTHVGYVPSGQYQELIDPMIPGSYVEGKDKSSGQIVQKFRFDASRIKNNVYTIDENGNVTKSRIQSGDGDPSSKYDFTPDGQLKAAPTPNGYRYFISGNIRGNNANGNAHTEDGSTQIWVEVKERGYSYDGKRQKKK